MVLEVLNKRTACLEGGDRLVGMQGHAALGKLERRYNALTILRGSPLVWIVGWRLSILT